MSFANEILTGTLNGVAAHLAHGADPNEIDEYGYPPLIEAAIANKVDVTELLLKAHADPNSTDLAGRTALHWAVENNNLALAKVLLDAGCDPNAYTDSSEPVLTVPFMRNNEEMKSLLYQHGAQLDFAKDYINAKLIGHRFELTGDTYITNSKNEFILVDMEGFFLEFSLRLIHESLSHFKSNFGARQVRNLFSLLHPILDALEVATELIKYQQYLTNRDILEERINFLLSQPLLLIPAVYQGHAITFIRFGKLFAKCDRGANSAFEGSVVIYRVDRPERMTPNFFKKILYQKQNDDFMHVGINSYLGLHRVANFPVGPQITGNCSWANVEAAVPTMLFLIMLKQAEYRNKAQAAITDAVTFFYEWHQWDQDRSLDQCITSLNNSTPIRATSKILLLVNILFQTCQYTDDKNVQRAEKIMKLLALPEYKPYLDNYVKVYFQNKPSKPGINLMHLFDMIK